MKRYFLIFVASIIFLSGCSGKTHKLREEVYKEAVSVIEVMDSYIKGELSAADADDKLSEISIVPLESDTKESVNGKVEADLLKIQIYFMDYASFGEKGGDGKKNYSDIYFKELRDKVAEQINYKK